MLQTAVKDLVLQGQNETDHLLRRWPFDERLHSLVLARAVGETEPQQGVAVLLADATPTRTRNVAELATALTVLVLALKGSERLLRLKR